MYIVVSTGERAARIASKLPDCIIIDRDPDSAERLKEKGFNVLNGDASNPEILARFYMGEKIILADNDNFNIKVAKTAKLLGLDVYAVAADEDKCWLYEVEGVSKICGSVEALLSTIFRKNRYFEIQVEAEMEGKTLKEYDAGEDCMVISVFRDGKVLQPFPDLELKAGDLLGLVCGEQVRTTKNPFDNILLLKGDMGEGEIREAEMVAKKFGANLITFEKVGGAYACALEGYGESVELEEAINILKKSDELDLIATTLTEKNKEILKKLVSSFPTLVLSGRDDYRRILALVNTSNPDTIISMAKAFSRFFGKAKALFLDEEQIKHFSKFTETDLEVEVSRGNPMVDAVKEFKSGYDLVILSLSNDIGNIDRDILWKIILDKESSVLVVE
ncbi:MAG: TRK potassium uptake system protein (TrkA-1) [Archaeoglobus fulgidus]|uniref:TRK potassium uptake system protein (TrkA-1) n=1 Tax=Archaeoglobus fulgidus TaxID=2234 RepID=A0A101E295_ARCFL|nr:NAD-binding protein [Archaeoglobus fulgidus]KUJ94545.1 MAG: TRK potassium uptake system protein (TrkA-1) [Archaeoglobus fulgidus]KUK07603.1 MAG: TRK potassium uptake system protein (TrkA-1) [Archaeoglobus fulgidus]